MGGLMKALLPIGEQSMIEHVSRQMSRLCSSVTVVVASEEQGKLLSGLNYPYLIDETPGRGPLAALHTALAYNCYSAVWVSACDMPFVSDKAAALLLREMEESGSMAAVPCLEGQLHPLQAIYRAECVEQVERCLQEGDYRMKGLLNKLNVVRVTEDKFHAAGINLSFIENINTPEQYEAALQVAEEEWGVAVGGSRLSNHGL
ncbi:putative molybdenum cofactor guanylyltransferase [Paenibacillus glycanilyticus]|uniref:Molybdenum cofactor guanylyltransferase n=2 Tax=Paenibacillus glycanilyticus TaxID=126569 RepID=A0ABQ6GHY8_9BACL|nr:putative molybdenum cofactor guanylyltransferase [Paenibacillus glycanilyticus]